MQNRRSFFGSLLAVPFLSVPCAQKGHKFKVGQKFRCRHALPCDIDQCPCTFKVASLITQLEGDDVRLLYRLVFCNRDCVIVILEKHLLESYEPA